MVTARGNNSVCSLPHCVEIDLKHCHRITGHLQKKEEGEEAKFWQVVLFFSDRERNYEEKELKE